MKTKTEIKNGSWMQFKNFIAVLSGVVLLCLAAANGVAQTYSIVHKFSEPSLGFIPCGALAQGSDGTLYGVTEEGGITYIPVSVTNYFGFNGYGTVFKVNPNGSGYMVLKHFMGSDGANPDAGVMVSGTTLYGTTYGGGEYDSGTVFRVNTDGSDFQVIKSFSGLDGSCPACSQLVLSGGTLYGTTEHGGVFNCGTVFKLNLDGSEYTVLKHFPGGDESCPCAGLVLSGTTIYGTTSGWQTYNLGTVFRINTDGSDYRVLRHFTGGSDGMSPLGTLAISGTTLYGTTYEGGGHGSTGIGDGTVFRMNTDGSGYNILRGDVGAPRGTIGLSGTALYGTAVNTVFKINTDGTGFIVLKRIFLASDGYYPQDLILSGAALYGTSGGNGLTNGVVFSLSLPFPNITKSPQSQTAEIGAAVQFAFAADASAQPPFEWVFDFTNTMARCTNFILRVTNIQPANIGTYFVVVTNSFGVATSSPAVLNVIAAVERRPVPSVKVTGQPGSLLNVDYANALSPMPDWTTLGSVSLTSTSQFYFDLTAPLPPQRFYRAWQTGTPSVIPSLGLNFVPAITVTGNVGDSLRLDYINAIGPTDAWVTLDTVTLTNTSQLYFDISAPAQPTRLYRIIPVP